MSEGDGWSVYQKLVIHRLDTMDERLEHLEQQFVLMQIDLAQRKVKAGLWGGLVGTLTAIATSIVAALT